jgi:outer membrane protein OmpA-like peptidoglycan-associated protein
MKGKLSVFGLMLIGSVFISCSARKDLIVLMPDPDGKVGTVEVSTQAGLQVLAKARESTEVAAANAAPTRPILLEEHKIAAVFGAAFAARPEPPLRFLLYFESGLSDLTPDSARVVPEILKAVRARRSTDISVVGHTDQSGTKEINDRLSLDRAVRIKTILTENGVAADNIDVDSHGQNNPLIPTAPGQAEPRNRRVEVIVR